ncbi:PRC-barrel domain containing protein [Chelativorans sp. ZYF759]|uniref:PRC-barrel domain-containing protein n=1 Tax=Chelativorans sp. ZYF759 TaxID=2692213 RepID=UPI00145C6000|nr:PRC-barrel domain-containing protein [Chelativorans sp. ZYF759]NMG38295.1 PRC-barrel domain containing protein [Chelativorans sp. ZYF759]
MVRNLLASTAIATLIATGAYAQTTTEPVQEPAVEMEQQEMQVERAPGHLASNIIGESVYNSVADDAENIGNVNDIVLGVDGEAEYVIIGVGGFLGLGQRDVAIPFEELEWSERDGQAWLVVNTTRESLEAQPEFDTSAYDPALGVPARDTAAAPAGDATQTTDTAAAPADDMAETDDDMAAAPADDMTATDDDSVAAAPTDDVDANDDVAATDTDQMETGAVDPTTLDGVDMGAISTDDLIGTTVYGANDENVGSVGDVILSQDGDVEAILVDVGGFLGMGTKEVALGMDNLEFMRDADGNMYLYTQFTEEQLEAQPEYDEATFAEQRDDQLLIQR